MSDGGDVMGWWGVGGHTSGPGDWRFPLYFLKSLFPFHTACLPPTLTVASDPEAPAAPHPGSGKSLSSMLLWVARFSQAKILGFAGYLCISFIYTLLRPRLHSSCNPLCSPPVSVGEMAAPGAPNIYVYCSFRAINLKGSVQDDETLAPRPHMPPPPPPTVAALGRCLSPDSEVSLSCVTGGPCSRVLSGRCPPSLPDR